MEMQRSKIAKVILQTEVSDIKIYQKATAIRRVWYWSKARHLDQGDRMEFRTRPMHLWSTDFQQRFQQGNITGKGKSLQ